MWTRILIAAMAGLLASFVTTAARAQNAEFTNVYEDIHVMHLVDFATLERRDGVATIGLAMVFGLDQPPATGEGHIMIAAVQFDCRRQTWRSLWNDLFSTSYEPRSSDNEVADWSIAQYGEPIGQVYRRVCNYTGGRTASEPLREHIRQYRVRQDVRFRILKGERLGTPL